MRYAVSVAPRGLKQEINFGRILDYLLRHRFCCRNLLGNPSCRQARLALSLKLFLFFLISR
jgi:hypothetical protein